MSTPDDAPRSRVQPGQAASAAPARDLELAGADPSPAFESLLRLLARQLDLPLAGLGLIDGPRGLRLISGGPSLDLDHSPLMGMAVRRALREVERLEISDLRLDAEFSGSVEIGGASGLVFCAGVPLRTAQGVALGALCVWDRGPRRLDASQRQTLDDVAATCVDWLEDQARLAQSLRRSLAPQLERDELRLHLAVEAAQLAFWEYEQRTQQFLLSPTWCVLTGRPERDTQGLSIGELEQVVHADDLSQLRRHVLALRNGTLSRVDFEIRVLRPDEGSVWLHCAGRVTERGADGHALRAVGTLQDVSASKEAEMALVRSVSITRATLESTADAFLVADRGGRILYHNRQFMNFWGLVPSDLETGNAHSLRVAGVRLLNPSGLADLIARAEGSAEPETIDTLDMVDGRSIEILSRPMFARGEVIGRVWTQRDVTARRSAQQAAELAAQEAKAASRAKSDFLATVSHEMRTPLNGVIGLTQLLMQERLTPGQRQYADLIHSSAQVLLALINDLLDLAAIESGRLTMEPADFDLPALVQDCAATFVGRAREKQLLYRIEVDAAVPQWVHGDSLRLRQVLVNLLSNALKYTHAGQVQLGVHAQAQPTGAMWIRFEVQDTGIGIPAHVQPSLFQRFSRGDIAPGAAYRGTGLGLAIVKQLCELMDGEVKLHSAPGQGTRITVALPLPGAHAPPEHRADDTTSTLSPQLARILVAEDNTTNQVVLMGLLQQLGYHDTQLAADGQAALDLAMHQPFDVVLMDCNMPVVDGYDAAQRMRAQGLNLPIIAMTANATESHRMRCVEAGMNDFLSKPLDRAQLQDCLSRWLSRSSSRRSPAPTLQVAATDSAQVYEREAVRERLGLDDDLIRQILSSFVEEFPTVLAAMQSALATHDQELLRHTLHALGGASATVGAGVMAQQVRGLEAAVVRGELAEVKHALPSIEAQLALFMLEALG